MDSYLFQKNCKEFLIKYYRNFGIVLTIEDIYVVWSCKTLQNNKVLISTNISDGMYYEFTYNGDKSECYFDSYKKQENRAIKFIEEV